jgi:hypothetical protein
MRCDRIAKEKRKKKKEKKKGWLLLRRTMHQAGAGFEKFCRAG